MLGEVDLSCDEVCSKRNEVCVLDMIRAAENSLTHCKSIINGLGYPTAQWGGPYGGANKIGCVYMSEGGDGLAQLVGTPGTTCDAKETTKQRVCACKGMSYGVKM